MHEVGIIGAGGIAAMHAVGLRALPDRFGVKAAADSDPVRREAFGARYGIPGLHEDYRRILEDPGIGAVLVLVPHDLHERVCVEAFQAGKHVLVEKPIARTVAEADRILAASKRAGRTLMVAHNQRFFPVHRRIRALIDDGTLGEPFCARVDHYQDFNPPAGSWWRNRDAVGGGAVIGSGIHRLDLLRWFLGEVEEVRAVQGFDPRRLEAEVCCAAALRFRSGAVGDFLVDWGAFHPRYGESLSVSGRDGCVSCDTRESTLHLGTKRGADIIDCGPGRPEDSMWAHFADCIDETAVPLTSGEEGRRSLALVEAVVRAAATGLPVRLPADR